MPILAHHDPSWVLLGVAFGVGIGLTLVWSVLFGRRNQ